MMGGRRFWWRALAVMAVTGFVYAMTAGVTFALRHPWMTDTQRMLHTWEALTFRTVEVP